MATVLLSVAFLVSMADAAGMPLQAPPDNSTSAAGSPGYQNAATQMYLEILNGSLGQNYTFALAGVVAATYVFLTARRINAHVRHLALLNGEGALRYFSKAWPAMSALKRNLLYAPILSHRRAREITMSRHVSFGLLPTRLQAIFITLIIITNVFTSVWGIPWSNPELEVLPILRNRTGSLAVANLLPIMLIATIQNPLISLLNISYDTFNLLHRWFGRIAILQAIAHALCYTIGTVKQSGWAGLMLSLSNTFIRNGLVAVIAFIIIMIQSPKVSRNLAYELFSHLHFVLVVIVLVFLWMHLARFPQQVLLMGAIAGWVISRTLRLMTLLYRSVGNGGTKAIISPLPGGAVKISIKTARAWPYRPGQSLYLTIPAIGLWTAHPFSIAWSGGEELSESSDPAMSTFSERKSAVHTEDVELNVQQEKRISLIVKKKSGMTRKLWDRAIQTNGPITLNAYIEGPYGTQKSLATYGTVMLFAGGVGITHQLGYVKELVEGYSQGTVAARRVTLVWVMPYAISLAWVRSWMSQILSLEGRRDVLRVLLYITRAGIDESIRSSSDSVQVFTGRPNVLALMQSEAQEKAGSIGVSVCAGGGLADEVRTASRTLLNEGANLDFIEEGFGW